MAGASQIVAVDLIDAKLEVAMTLGATTAINVRWRPGGGGSARRGA